MDLDIANQETILKLLARRQRNANVPSMLVEPATSAGKC